MNADEREARSNVYTRCAIIVPTSTGRLAVFKNDRHTLIGMVPFGEPLGEMILEAAKPTTVPIPMQPKREATRYTMDGLRSGAINIEELDL